MTLSRKLDDLNRKGLQLKEVELHQDIQAELSKLKPSLDRLDHMRKELRYVTLRLYRNRKSVIPRYVQGGAPGTGKRR